MKKVSLLGTIPFIIRCRILISESWDKNLDNVYKDTPTQKKTRLVLSDLSGEYDDYIITADIPEDKPEICWIEFESKDGRIHKEFKEPKWISK